MPKKVMFAEDQEDVLALVSATLGGDDRFTLLLARDGKEALEMARREKPDLLFLDVYMPKMNGYDVCKALKEDPATSHIQIIMLTAMAQEADRQKALKLGAVDYFTKPFSPAVLLRKVEEYLGL